MTATVNFGSKRAYSELRTVAEEFTIDWKLCNFITWADSKEVGHSHVSPIFKFQMASLRKTRNFSLTIYPKGMPSTTSGDQASFNREDQIGIFLNNNNEEELGLKMRLHMLNKNGVPFKSLETERKMDPDTDWGWKNVITRSRLLSDAANTLPDGHLMIRCDVIIVASFSSNVSYDLTPPLKKTKSLQSDLHQLKISAKFSDFQIVCQDTTFDVHKSIIAARSDVFEAMLRTNSVEAAQGRVRIDDFEPADVEKFINFVYTGELTEADASTQLLLLADKYNVQDLVSECEAFLVKNIGVANVVDYLDIACKVSSARVLLKNAAGFIARDFARIKKTAEWAALEVHNPAALKHVLDEFA